MDGNVDPEGIRLDLEWLHRVGVRGVQMFDGGMGTPLVVPERVRHGSAEWQAAVRHAVATAAPARAGVHGGDQRRVERGRRPLGGARRRHEEGRLVGDRRAGWRPGRAAARAAARGRRPVPGLSALGCGPDRAPLRAGLGRRRGPGRRRSRRRLVPMAVAASAPLDDWSCLVDGAFDDAVSLPRDPDGPSTAWIEQLFDEPVTVGSVTVGLPGPRGFGAAPPPDAVLEASDDGVHYRVVAEVSEIVVPAAKAVPVRTVAFPPVTARRFRLVLTGISAADALPRLAPGVQLPPVLRRVSEFLVTEFALAPGGRVHQAEVKAGFAAAPDYDAIDTDPAAATQAIDPAQVHDVSAHVDEQGVLRWEAPAGDWVVLRLGASLTGQTNGPAPPEATGLEVDKLDATKVRRYLEHLPRAVRRRRALGRAAQRQHRVRARRTSPRRCASGSPSCGATTRCPGCRRSPGTSSATRRDPTGSCGTTGGRSPTCWRGSTTARSRQAAHDRGPDLLRRGARGPPPAARRRPGDAQPRRRADGRHVDVRRRRPAEPDVRRRPEGRLVRRARLRQAVHRRRVDERLPPAVELHAAAAEARRRPRAGPRRHPVLHPHVPAPADPGAAARDRPLALPRPDVHPLRAVGGAGRALDRLPGPLLVPAQPGRAGGRRGRLHRRGGAADRAVRRHARRRRAGRPRPRLREPRRARGPRSASSTAS